MDGLHILPCNVSMLFLLENIHKSATGQSESLHRSDSVRLDARRLSTASLLRRGRQEKECQITGNIKEDKPAVT